jgi:hypothetical protein
MSTQKSKIIAFKGSYATKCKIVVDGITIEQTSYLNYLWSNMTFKKDDNVFRKLCRFQNVCGSLTGTTRRKSRKETVKTVTCE